jgi:hypothetical protein
MKQEPKAEMTEKLDDSQVRHFYFFLASPHASIFVDALEVTPRRCFSARLATIVLAAPKAQKILQRIRLFSTSASRG